MTKEERIVLIADIAQAACDSFDLKEHLRALFWDTTRELETESDDYLKEQAEFFYVDFPND